MIRPARTEDAPQAAPLLCAAWGNLGLALTGGDDTAEAQRIVADFFVQEGNRVSYANALVAEHEGRVIGVAVCYHGNQAEALDHPLTAQLRARTGNPTATIQTEAAPDEFYLDTLSVHSDYQRRGIGSALMRAFEQRAAERGCHKLALLVEEENEIAFRLYAKLGYTADGMVQLASSPFHHMIKSSV